MLALVAIGFLAVYWPVAEPVLRGLASTLYARTSGLGYALSGPLNTLRLEAGTSFLVPLLLGLMAVTAPCQLSTGTAALAYVLKDAASGQALPRAMAFLFARVLMYSSLGVTAALFFGGRLDAPGEGLLLIRKLIGPLMLLGGLILLGFVRPRLSLGSALASYLTRLGRGRLGQLGSGVPGAFLLGTAFSLSFCPTLFFLFFGLTVPLSLTVPLGFSYPALFALGMTFPLLAVSAFFVGRSPAQTHYLTGRLRRVRRVLTPLAGTLFLLAGLNDTFVYWLL